MNPRESSRFSQIRVGVFFKKSPIAAQGVPVSSPRNLWVKGNKGNEERQISRIIDPLRGVLIIPDNLSVLQFGSQE